MKRVLMVAFHFPPLSGSSGIQRTLRFVQHLPRFDWQPLVLTANSRAYEKTSNDLMSEVSPEIVVNRALAFDAARHLAIGGRHFAWMARPDRWTSWRFDGIRQGMKMIREFQPEVLWSTYPIPTAHLIAAELQRRSGLPWIADFRDPMAQDGYPADPKTWVSYKQIESVAIERSSALTFTTPGAVRDYRMRYPDSSEKIQLLENGYDEESFAGASQPEHEEPLTPGAITLLHSGIIYPEERDPTALFAALSRLSKEGRIRPANFRIRFRAPVHEGLLRDLAAKHGVEKLVEICPAIPYRQALAEMLRADGLLILQASNCNDQIPAKIYEYMRAGRPIIAMTDPAGDTADVMRRANIDTIVRLDSADDIESALPKFIDQISNGQAPIASPLSVRDASRLGRTAALAQILARLAGE